MTISIINFWFTRRNRQFLMSLSRNSLNKKLKLLYRFQHKFHFVTVKNIGKILFVNSLKKFIGIKNPV